MKKDVVVGLRDGLDVGKIALLVQNACRFESTVYLESEGKKVNAKSIMGMMNMVVAKGKTVSVIAEGADEEEAIAAMEETLLGQE